MRLRSLLARLRVSLWPWHRDVRLDEEIREHLAALTDDFVRGGMSERDARAAARRAFGPLGPVRANYREQLGLPRLDSLLQDVRIGARFMRRQPRATFLAVFILGVGIGANHVFFTLVDAICLRGLPLADADRIVVVRLRAAEGGSTGVSYPEFRDLREGLRTIDGLSAFVTEPVTFGDERQAPERLTADYVSAGAFETLGLRPLLGREFSAEDERPGAGPVVVLGSAVWRARYDGDVGIVGRTVRVNGIPSTVVGVVPAESGFPSQAQLWLPLTRSPGLLQQPRGLRRLFAYGRIGDGVSAEQAGAEVHTMLSRRARETGESFSGVRAAAVPIDDEVTSDIADPNWLAFITAGLLVVFIACANVANLLIMRAVHRTREMAVRSALGGTRARLTRQLLVESALMAASAGIVGLALSAIGLRLVSVMLPEGALPYWMMPRAFDLRVFAALVVVCLGSVFAFGLAPAVLVSRSAVAASLREAHNSSPGSRVKWWSTGLVSAQVGLAFVLLATVAIAARSALTPDPDVLQPDTDAITTAWITLPPERYPSRDARLAFYEEVRSRLDGSITPAAVAQATTLPRGGAPIQEVTFASRPAPAGERPTTTVVVQVSSEFFAALGVPVVDGRALQREDWLAAPVGAIVNEAFVRRYLAGEETLGQQVKVIPPNAPAAASPWLTIVGVVPTIPQSPNGGPEPVVYVPFEAGAPPTAALLVKAAAGTRASVADALRQTVAAIDPDLPLYRVMDLAQAQQQAMWNGRLSSALAYGITALALVLALAGVHGLTAHMVAERMRELAVRMALGARGVDIARLMLRRLGLQLGMGIGGGAVLLLALRPIMNGLREPSTLTAVTVSIVAATLLAAAAPLRRAIAAAPASVLRNE